MIGVWAYTSASIFLLELHTLNLFKKKKKNFNNCFFYRHLILLLQVQVIT